jgi:hypothetical protein
VVRLGSLGLAAAGAAANLALIAIKESGAAGRIARCDRIIQHGLSQPAGQRAGGHGGSSNPVEQQCRQVEQAFLMLYRGIECSVGRVSAVRLYAASFFAFHLLRFSEIMSTDANALLLRLFSRAVSVLMRSVSAVR